MLGSAFSCATLVGGLAHATHADSGRQMRTSGAAFKLLAATALIAGVSAAASAASFGTNLVVNGDAETNTVTDFTATPGFQTLSYSFGGGFPVAGDPGVSEGGSYFFYADETGVTTAAQLIDVSSLGGSIDTGTVGYTLSALLGGYLTQDDQAALSATFMGAGNLGLGTGLLGPVTSADRSDLTGLLDRSATRFVPTGTRSINVLLTQTRFKGSSNDGYADNLSLVLNQSAVAGAVPEPAAWAMMLGGFGLIGTVARRRRQVAASVWTPRGRSAWLQFQTIQSRRSNICYASISEALPAFLDRSLITRNISFQSSAKIARSMWRSQANCPTRHRPRRYPSPRVGRCSSPGLA